MGKENARCGYRRLGYDGLKRFSARSIHRSYKKCRFQNVKERDITENVLPSFYRLHKLSLWAYWFVKLFGLQKFLINTTAGYEYYKMPPKDYCDIAFLQEINKPTLLINLKTMKLSIGIVGLPNVGKSTLFETLTQKQVDKANYPFCTIDPNIGVVAVPDERVDLLADLTHSQKKIYATIDFIDIAGLVKGASQGEGLGNKFLANIRETDAILYVLRAFSNNKIINTQNSIDPLRDKDILDTELILKDLETIEKRLSNLEGDIKRGDKEAMRDYAALSKAQKILEEGKILFEQPFTEEELKELNKYQLLTLKPRLYLLNGKDEESSSKYY